MRSCRAWIRDANRLNSTMNHSPPAGADGSTARRPTAAAGGPAAGPFPPRNRCARANPVRSNRSGARHGASWERGRPARKWDGKTAADRCGRDTSVRRTRRSQEAPFPGRAMGIDVRPRVGRREMAPIWRGSPGTPLHRAIRRRLAPAPGGPRRGEPRGSSPPGGPPPLPLPSASSPLPLRAPARRLLSGPPGPRRAGRRRGRREERGRPGGAPGDRRPRTPLRRPGARRRR